MVFFTCNRLLSGMKITNESEAFQVSSKVSHIDILQAVIMLFYWGDLHHLQRLTLKGTNNRTIDFNFNFSRCLFKKIIYNFLAPQVA